jgi:hypothetical protein
MFSWIWWRIKRLTTTIEKKDEEWDLGFRDLNWEIFVSTVILVPRAMSLATCKQMSTHHVDVWPKKGQISFLVHFNGQTNILD